MKTDDPGLQFQVCMGKKCKNEGGSMIAEKLEQVGSVKRVDCIGQCKKAPNMKVSVKR